MKSRQTIKTGVQGLDEVLTGGLPAGRMYLLKGPPGTGKTTLGLQFLIEGARVHEPAMYITLSESEDELRAVAESHGLSLDGIHISDLVSKVEPDREKHYTMFHPSEVELGEITKILFEEFERFKPVRLVFDSLSDLRLMAENPFRYRRQILQLKSFFTAKGATIIVLDDQTSDIDRVQIESMAHGVISLEHSWPGYGGARRRMRILKLRGVNFRGGYHDMNIVHGGVAVFPRLIAAEHGSRSPIHAFSSGVHELDQLTGGGLDLGSTTLLIGPAGSGKSIVAAQYTMAAVQKGLKPAYFAFDEGRETILHRAGGIGLDLRPYIESGECTVRQIDPAELSPGEFAGRIRSHVEQQGTRLVVVDSINGYYQSMPEERFLGAHLHELVAYLNQQGVLTILILTQQGVLGANMAVPVDVSYLADAIVMLRYFEYAGQIKQAISTLKKRTGNHERLMREFQIAGDGIKVGNPLKQFHGILTGVPVYTGPAEEMFPDKKSGV